MNAIDYFFEHSQFSEKLFILNKSDQISFSELFVKHRKIASFLLQKYGTGKNIMLCSSNNCFFVLCYLAIIKSGNVCVPVNPAASASTIEFISKETKPELVFLQKRHLLLFNNLASNFITDDSLGQILSSAYEDLPESNELVNSEQLAEIIYTSGSTAFPKGVMISHKNLIANTESIIEYLKISEKDRMLVVLPFYYCYGLSLLHTHLRVGASIAFNNTFMLIGSVLNDLKNHQCTGFAGVPSHYQILLRKSDSFKKTSFPHLRYVTQAGGKLHKVFIDEFVHSFPSIRFYVMYGQTEATARLSYLPPEHLKQKLGSIGIPIPNVSLKLFDNNGKEIDGDEIGEIYAKGDNIMKGYYNDDELTKKTLTQGFLKTGDLARKDQDGYFYLVARKKEIIKVGGERISPKEIEEVIVGISEVIDCTIEGVEDEVLGERIKATIVVNEQTDTKLLENKIIQECKNKLSSIKVPQQIEFENKINVNESGKKVKNH